MGFFFSIFQRRSEQPQFFAKVREAAVRFSLPKGRSFDLLQQRKKGKMEAFVSFLEKWWRRPVCVCMGGGV